MACGPSGFGANAPIVASDLSNGTLKWATVYDDTTDTSGGEPVLDFATATDAGVRIVGFTGGDGIAPSTDTGATWQVTATVPKADGAFVFAHVPGSGILVAVDPGAGLFSPD